MCNNLLGLGTTQQQFEPLSYLGKTSPSFCLSPGILLLNVAVFLDGNNREINNFLRSLKEVIELATSTFSHLLASTTREKGN